MLPEKALTPTSELPFYCMDRITFTENKQQQTWWWEIPQNSSTGVKKESQNQKKQFGQSFMPVSPIFHPDRTLLGPLMALYMLKKLN